MVRTSWRLQQSLGRCNSPDAYDKKQVQNLANCHFIEHGENTGDNDVGRSAVASSDVLD